MTPTTDPTSPTNFTTWLLANRGTELDVTLGRVHRSDVDDLAVDVREDPEWPHDGPDDRETYVAYLVGRGASDAAVHALQRAWRAYVASLTS